VHAQTSAQACSTYDNTASVTTSNDGSDTASASIVCRPASLLVTKTADAAAVVAGAPIGFTVTISNQGTGAASGVSLSDALPAGNSASPVVWAIAADSVNGAAFALAGSAGSQTLSLAGQPVSLAAGASLSVHVTAATTSANCAVYPNTANLSSSNDGSPSASASETVQCPSIAIEKSPDDSVVRDGSTVTFTVKVTNTGDVPLTDVTVSDPLTPSCVKAIGDLAAGASSSYDCTTDALHVSFTNLASVTGTPPVGPDVTASDTAPVTVIHPAIAIEKSPDGQSVTRGGTVTFTIKVTNSGDVDLSNVTVADPLTGSCAKTLGTLLQGASTSYTCTTDALSDSFTNLASVTGTPPVGPDVTASDTAPVTVTTPPAPPVVPTHPGITITKTPKTQTVTTGLTVTFSITVTNSGDVTLTDVNVTDALSPGCARTKADLPALASMAPGATLTYQCTSPAVTASFTNVAIATGTPPSGGNVTASDSAAVTAIAPLKPPTKKKPKPKVVSHKKPKATG
jgi:uncharacterized repeat protein (TIGR01451 family)